MGWTQPSIPRKDFKRKTLSFFHMNVWSLTKNFDDFNILLNDLNVNFDTLAITESHIKKDSSSPVNLCLGNYSIEQTPTETSPCGTILYVSKRLSYQLRNDLKLYIQEKLNKRFLRYFNFNPSFKLRWCCAWDLFGSQIPVTTGGFELWISCIPSGYLIH